MDYTLNSCQGLRSLPRETATGEGCLCASLLNDTQFLFNFHLQWWFLQ